MASAPRQLPVCLRQALAVDELIDARGCDATITLGSFWPYSRSSFESRLVKSLKDCIPVSSFQPHVTNLAWLYVGLITSRLAGERFDWVVRVLSSAEKQPERSRPLALLADVLCTRLGAKDLTHVFYKSESRPPMRVVRPLSGAEALGRRLHYVMADLFVKPMEAGGSVLLVDDICNTGASMRVYAEALKRFAGARRVVGVNLAATRFAGGKDGWGMLKLDTAGLAACPDLACVWLDAAGHYHASRDCSAAQPPVSCEPRFAADRAGTRCEACLPDQGPKPRWLRALGLLRGALGLRSGDRDGGVREAEEDP